MQSVLDNGHFVRKNLAETPDFCGHPNRIKNTQSSLHNEPAVSP